MVVGLAAVLVRFELISIDARAEVRAFGICAHLRAQAWRIAFVQVLAGKSIFSELFSRWANANGSKRSFLTAVRALTVLMLTLSKIAAFAFVSAVRTISHVVAHRSHVDAASCDSRTLPLTDRASEWRRNASVFMRLIRIVTAVVFSIANVGFEDALRVLALEEVVRARNRSAVEFIRMIVAIVGSIAMPRNRNADAGGLASEVLFLIALVRLHRGTAQLVRSVIAIRNSVALVRLFDTLPQVCALELVR